MCSNVLFQFSWQEFDIPGHKSQPEPLTWRWRISSFFNSERWAHRSLTWSFARSRRLVIPLFPRITHWIHGLKPTLASPRGLQSWNLLRVGLYTQYPWWSPEILTGYGKSFPGKPDWWFNVIGNTRFML
jgi:hypothetical protein